ncbi:sialin-like [Prorops nasuta]|uniref:sialin-like n=1 Tax=Prorops nasuta TaxID=863751 RepID=UPI0034CEC972
MANPNLATQQSHNYLIEQKVWSGLQWLPTRLVVCIMMFTCCWTSYMFRLQMPILIVPMTVNTVQDIIGSCHGMENYIVYPLSTTTFAATPDLTTIIDKPLTSRTKRFVPGINQRDLNASLEGHIINISSITLFDNDNDKKDTLQNAIKLISRNYDTEMSNRMLQNKYFLFGPDADMSNSHLLDRYPFTDEMKWPPEKISFSIKKKYSWSDRLKSQLVKAYSYGNVPGNLIGGILTVKWGPRNAVMWTSLVAAMVSLVTPIIAEAHWRLLLCSRVIVGITGGVTFPACHALISKWAPPQEKSRFVWSLLGGTFGTIFTYPLLITFAANEHWVFGWYIPSMLMLFWVIIWANSVYDSPSEHPGITNEEKEYILKSQANTVSQQKLTLKQIPIQQICTSIPFISLVFCHFGNLFLIFIYQNTMMMYMKKVLRFDLTESGIMCSMPWVGRMLFAFGFGWIADKIMEKRIMSITRLRKCATLFSHFIPAIMLLMAAYANCHEFLTNFYFFLALAFNGAASVAILLNNHDLSPNFACVLYGVMNSVGGVSGIIISRMVQEFIMPYGPSIDYWQKVFLVGAIVCSLSMLIFVVGGSGKVQKWNEIISESDVEANL